jgi:tetratricopeptide (TPR) repeat protein
MTGNLDNLPSPIVRSWEGILRTFGHRFIVLLFIATEAMLAGPATADDVEACSKESDDVAIAACTRAIADFFYKRGNVYAGKGDINRAIANYNQAIRLNPQFAGAFNNRGSAYNDKRQYDRAIQDYDQAIRFNPQYAVAFFNRGVTKRRKGDTTGGDADISIARQLQPGIGQ